MEEKNRDKYIFSVIFVRCKDRGISDYRTRNIVDNFKIRDLE